ncbi:MAG: hypothetical protein KBD76_02720 [Bacteriovorax sp.]|nr:hypothetical protein [Bacteriovorax sp.]
MKKPLLTAIHFFSLIISGLSIHQAFAQRDPAVGPMTEISLEENRPKSLEHGFDFGENSQKILEPARLPANANIVAKTQTKGTPYSYAGPMIFLLALPLALWIVVSKKMKAQNSEKIDYYPRTLQFKPHKTNPRSPDIDEEDQDYPKAS